MVLDGSDRNEQAARDLLVGVALGKQLKNLLLPGGEAAWVGSRRGTCPGGNRTHTEVPHGTAYHTCGGVSTKINKPRQGLSKIGLLPRVQQRQCGFIGVAQPIPQFSGMCSIPSNV